MAVRMQPSIPFPAEALELAETMSSAAAADGTAVKQQQMTLRDAASRAGGSRLTSAATGVKPPSSVRKTFKFFHTE